MLIGRYLEQPVPQNSEVYVNLRHPNPPILENTYSVLIIQVSKKTLAFADSLKRSINPIGGTFLSCLMRSQNLLMQPSVMVLSFFIFWRGRNDTVGESWIPP